VILVSLPASLASEETGTSRLVLPAILTQPGSRGSGMSNSRLQQEKVRTEILLILHEAELAFEAYQPRTASGMSFRDSHPLGLNVWRLQRLLQRLDSGEDTAEVELRIKLYKAIHDAESDWYKLNHKARTLGNEGKRIQSERQLKRLYDQLKRVPGETGAVRVVRGAEDETQRLYRNIRKLRNEHLKRKKAVPGQSTPTYRFIADRLTKQNFKHHILEEWARRVKKDPVGFTWNEAVLNHEDLRNSFETLIQKAKNN
jgi:hypothetical protein